MKLNTLVGWSAFSATFRAMFIEEFRENLDLQRRGNAFPIVSRP